MHADYTTLSGVELLISESRYLPKVYINFFLLSKHILWQDLAHGPPSCSVLRDKQVHSPDSTLNAQKSDRSTIPSQPPIR